MVKTVLLAASVAAISLGAASIASAGPGSTTGSSPDSVSPRIHDRPGVGIGDKRAKARYPKKKMYRLRGTVDGQPEGTVLVEIQAVKKSKKAKFKPKKVKTVFIQGVYGTCTNQDGSTSPDTSEGTAFSLEGELKIKKNRFSQSQSWEVRQGQQQRDLTATVKKRGKKVVGTFSAIYPTVTGNECTLPSTAFTASLSKK